MKRIARRFFIGLALAALLVAQTATVASFAEITGDAAAHQIAASGSARWIQFIAPAGNGLSSGLAIL